MSEAQSDPQESRMFNDRFRDDAGAYRRAAGRDALDEARDADRLIRSTPGHNRRYRRWRTLAVVEALAAGVPIQEVADALGMPVSDVEHEVACVVDSTDVDDDAETERRTAG
jgi:glycosyltransferase involved in cell wall biosynthesis